MDGITFLRKLMSESPVPVVVCSGIAERGAEAALTAIEREAVEVITKTQAGRARFPGGAAVTLIDAVRAAAHGPAPAGATPWVEGESRAHGHEAALARRRCGSPPDKTVAIGASTGGTEALRTILEAMPPDAPGMVVGNTCRGSSPTFAVRLDHLCRHRGQGGSSGGSRALRVAPDRPGNRHTRLGEDGRTTRSWVDDGPRIPASAQRDVLFRSVAKAAGPNALGVILPGWVTTAPKAGGDEAGGGGPRSPQDERSCVVSECPRRAIERARGGSTVVPLSRMRPRSCTRPAGATAPRRLRRGAARVSRPGPLSASWPACGSEYGCR